MLRVVWRLRLGLAVSGCDAGGNGARENSGGCDAPSFLERVRGLPVAVTSSPGGSATPSLLTVKGTTASCRGSGRCSKHGPSWTQPLLCSQYGCTGRPGISAPAASEPQHRRWSCSGAALAFPTQLPSRCPRYCQAPVSVASGLTRSSRSSARYKAALAGTLRTLPEFGSSSAITQESKVWPSGLAPPKHRGWQHCNGTTQIES